MSIQAEQLTKYAVQMPYMKGWRSGTGYEAPNREPYAADFCPVSVYRAAMVSRSPGQVLELVRTLSENCFDVMVLRQWEPRVVSALDTGLILADMTGCMNEKEFEAERRLLIPQIGQVDIPVMYLVNEELMSRAGSRLLDEELMVWPLRSRETMLYHVQRTIRKKRTARPPMDKNLGEPAYKDLWIDRDRMLVHRGSEPVHLTKTEYSLLLLLVDSDGAVKSREELMSEIWDTDFLGGSNVVDVHIKSLRKKLRDNAGSPQYIATVRGVGYRLAD